VRRALRLATRGVGATILATTVLIGAAAASTGPEVCSAGDQPACLTISDTDDVARSTESTSRYGTFSFAVRNGGGIRLHSTLALKLVDVVSGEESLDAEQPSTAVFNSPLPAGCSSPAPDELFCELPVVKAGETIQFGPAVVRTSTTGDADATRVLATLARAPKPDEPESQPETLLTSSEDLVYGAVGDNSSSIVFAGASTVLETATDDVQSSVFPINVPQSFEGFLLTSIKEFDPSDEEYFCLTETGCFGQSVETTAPGIFSSGNPVELLVTLQRSAVPKGITARNLKVTHRHDDGSVVVITRNCAGAIGTVPPLSKLPCRRVSLDTETQTITIDVWDLEQGDWGFS
jgi:hypothetical protein